MPRPTRRSSTAAAIDDHVGAQIRQFRIMRGLSQPRLAKMVGVSYQQENKYEKGMSSISAGRLFEIALALNAPIDYFFEGVGQEIPRPITPRRRLLLEMTRSFAEISDERRQEAVINLIRLLAYG